MRREAINIYGRNMLYAEVIRRNCALLLLVAEPGDALPRLASFFQERKILIDNLQLHRNSDGTAQVIVHCQVEKDRITRTVILLEQMLGVVKVELLK